MAFEIEDFNVRLQEAFQEADVSVPGVAQIAAINPKEFLGFKGQVKNPDNPVVGYGHRLGSEHSDRTLGKLGIDPFSLQMGEVELTEEQGDFILAADQAEGARQARDLIDNYNEFHPDIQDALNDMATDLLVNKGDLGGSSKLQFLSPFRALEGGRPLEAAAALANTPWAKKSGKRAAAIVNQIMKAGQE